MQNQQKPVKTSKHRSLASIVKSKSQKDDFDNARSTHESNIHQSTMNEPQNEDIAVKSSIKTPSFMKFEQQTAFSEHNLKSYERVQEQIESILNAILGKDEYFNSSSSGYLTSILVDRIHSRPGIVSQMLELKASNTLQNLNLFRILPETEQQFLSLSYNCSLQPSEVLSLVEVPRRDNGIKRITENLNLKSFQTLNLCDFQVDDPGAKHSLVNESWNYLEELKLCPTSISEDLRIEDLNRDKAWTHFKRILLWDCNADKLTIKCLQFNKLLNYYPTIGYSVNREEKVKKQDTELSKEAKRSSITELKEVPLALIMQSLEPDKRSFHDLNKLNNEISQNTDKLLRGGLPETQGTNSEYRDLLIKLEEYKEKVLSKNHDENEFNLYIEPLIRSENRCHPELKGDNDRKDKLKSNNNIEEELHEEEQLELEDEDDEEEQERYYRREQKQQDEDDEGEEQNEEDNTNIRHLSFNTEPFDLLKDIRKQFLTSDKTIEPQVLLLTGQAGSGKSLFCKHLQKDLLTTWNSSLLQETEENLWFPIYIDCSLMKKFETDTITRILKNELFITEEGTKIIQTSEACNIVQPNLLIIFDGCDTAVQTLLEEVLISQIDSQKCNIPCIIGAEKYQTMKILITCREESLSDIKQRELLFAPTQHEQHEELSRRSLNSTRLFLQRRIEPFSDEQITMYLIKCCFQELLKTSNETKIQKGKDFTQPFELLSNLLPSSSWATVKNFESMIDSYGLRKTARTPFMLRIMVEVLPIIVAKNISEQDQLKPKTLTAYHLIKQFIDIAIQLNAQLRLAALAKTKSEESANELEKADVTKLLTTEIRQQLQNLAIKT